MLGYLAAPLDRWHSQVRP